MNRLSEFLSQHIGVELWIASLAAIALVTVIANQVAQVLLRQAARVTAKTSTVWDDALVGSASRPLLVAMWVVGAGFMARVLQREVDIAFVEQALELRDVALIGCVAWFLVRFAGKVGRNIESRRLARGEEVDHTTVDALVKLARLVTVVVAVITAAQTLGFQIAGLLALGGVGGIAVGFAAKDILANFFGGLTIYLDRPFGVGEWIRSPDKSIEGTVEYISWRHTRIRAFNKNPIYVPNAVFTSIVVENPSRMSHRRIKETIGLRYDDFAVVAPIVDEVRAMLQAHESIDATQTLIVAFNQFGASSLDIMVYTFTKTTVWVEYHHVKQDVLLKIGEIIERHGAQIAFPTQTLHLRSEGPEADPGGGPLVGRRSTGQRRRLRGGALRVPADR
ncbi:MAG: mechanosensitive ion channel family protein [Burkholderiales bacterium]|nr:mechanosensitive ion channel family protein [Burkholderiales bacterium]